MKLAKALNEKLYDVRLQDKLVGEGKLSREGLKNYCQSLVDDSENAIYVDLTNNSNSSDSSEQAD